MKLIYLPLMCVAAVSSLTSCSVFKSNKTTAPEPVKTETLGQTEQAIEHVLYGDWFITHAGKMDLSKTISALPIVNFSQSDAQNPYLVNYSAFDGCNYNNGTFAITPNGKMQSAGEPISTMKFCGDSPYEVAVVTGLRSVAQYKLDKNDATYTLYMLNAAADTLLVLRKSNIDFINGAWSVDAIGGTSVPESAEIQLVIDVPEKTIHGNAGCNTLNGKISIDNDSGSAIRFNDVITTRMTCPDIATEQRFLQALNTVVAVRAQATTEGASLIDAQGNEVISLSRLHLK